MRPTNTVNDSTSLRAAVAPAPPEAAPARASNGRPGGGARALPADFVEACRAASLQVGGPSLARLGVTSAIRGEGRSSVARAMACIQEEDYRRRVVLLELDLGRPTLARSLGASPSPGILEFAKGSASLDSVLQPISHGITLITAGAPGGSATRSMADVLRPGLLAEIRERCDIIIADLPPLLGWGFGGAGTAAFPELLLVVRAGVTPAGRIREAIAQLPGEPNVLLNGTHSALPRWLRQLMAV
jgi:Mrp family chromosome partitioning ATPase